MGVSTDYREGTSFARVYAHLFCDNLAQHLKEPVNMFGLARGIVTHFYPPNSTHLFAPPDCKIFANFKKNLLTRVHNLEASRSVSGVRENFSNIVTEMCHSIADTNQQADVVRSSFDECGIVPHFSARQFTKHAKRKIFSVGNCISSSTSTTASTSSSAGARAVSAVRGFAVRAIELAQEQRADSALAVYKAKSERIAVDIEAKPAQTFSAINILEKKVSDADTVSKQLVKLRKQHEARAAKLVTRFQKTAGTTCNVCNKTYYKSSSGWSTCTFGCGAFALCRDCTAATAGARARGDRALKLKVALARYFHEVWWCANESDTVRGTVELLRPGESVGQYEVQDHDIDECRSPTCARSVAATSSVLRCVICRHLSHPDCIGLSTAVTLCEEVDKLDFPFVCSRVCCKLAPEVEEKARTALPERLRDKLSALDAELAQYTDADAKLREKAAESGAGALPSANEVRERVAENKWSAHDARRRLGTARKLATNIEYGRFDAHAKLELGNTRSKRKKRGESDEAGEKTAKRARKRAYTVLDEYSSEDDGAEAIEASDDDTAGGAEGSINVMRVQTTSSGRKSRPPPALLE